MERLYGCEVKPYLFEDSGNVDDGVIEDLLKIDECKDSTNSGDDDIAPDEPDYTVEKYIFYDDFVRKLQVLNIVHTAFAMCEKLVKVG